MACFSPVGAWQRAPGAKLVFKLPDMPWLYKALAVPCNGCIGCRLDRSVQWASRVMHEASLYPYSSFVTLTYDGDHVPVDGSIRYSDFVRFMKSLRKRYERSERQRIRFYMCGEYGSDNGRPHFHVCLFNCFFADRQFYRELPSGSKLYRSAELESLWKHGFSSIGDVTFDSAAYVARYCMKKITGDEAAWHYRRVSPDGEVYWIVPEFNRMSLKPGIGAGFFDKYTAEVFPRDFVRVGGRKLKPPKYYDRRMAARDAAAFDVVRAEREVKAMRMAEDCTPARLKVREEVLRAGLRTKIRPLE